MEEFIGYIEAYDIEDPEPTRGGTPTEEGARFPALNPHAWVLATQGWHHICNNRSLYATFEDIEPNPTYSRFGKTGEAAMGVGTIRLPVQLQDGSTLRLPFNEVLFVPARKVNSLSLKRLHHGGTAIDHRSGLAYDAHDRAIMWFPPDSDGGLPTLRLAAGVPDQLYLADTLTDDEGYSDAWVKTPPVACAVNGFAEALQAVHRIRECSASRPADPALVRRLLAKRVVNVTVDDLVKLLGIQFLATTRTRGGGGGGASSHGMASPGPPPQHHHHHHQQQPARPYSMASAHFRQPLAQRSSNARASMPPQSQPSSSKRLVPGSRSEFVKSQWGSRPAFQAAYGLKMTAEDMEEGDAMLERFHRNGYFR